jgi:hypothetical protein
LKILFLWAKNNRPEKPGKEKNKKIREEQEIEFKTKEKKRKAAVCAEVLKFYSQF